MKCFTINSSCLEKFNIWSAEFYTLLKKEEYEDILKLSVSKIKQKIKDLNLSREELEQIKKQVYKSNFRGGSMGYELDLLRKGNEKNLYRNYVFLLGGLRIYLKDLKENIKKEKEFIKRREDFIKRF